MIGISVSVEDDAIQALIEEINNAVVDTEDYDQALNKLAQSVRRQILNGRYKDRTTNLRSRLRVFVQDNSLKIKMLDYGYYLSFGTTGSKSSSEELSEGVANVFNRREGSLFKRPDKSKGIPAMRFYPTDIEEQILAKLEAMIDID
jgi:hypothetical protein